MLLKEAIYNYIHKKQKDAIYEIRDCVGIGRLERPSIPAYFSTVDGCFIKSGNINAIDTSKSYNSVEYYIGGNNNVVSIRLTYQDYPELWRYLENTKNWNMEDEIDENQT